MSKPLDLEALDGMDAAECAEVALRFLADSDTTSFWLICGFVCAKTADNRDLQSRIWNAGHREPADVDDAVAALRTLLVTDEPSTLPDGSRQTE